jgi:hypothetical protein
MKNIEYLGFTFSKRLIDVLQSLPLDEFLGLYHQLVKDLKSLVWANVIFRPMYPNFPQQVMMASEAELYVNALYHYVTLKLPEHVALERFSLLDQVDLKIIDLGSLEDFDQNMRNLIGAKSSISESDREDVPFL